MKIESALHSIVEMFGEACLNKVDQYSQKCATKQENKRPKICNFYGSKGNSSIAKYAKSSKVKIPHPIAAKSGTITNRQVKLDSKIDGDAKKKSGTTNKDS